jgi:hypothetical protein
MKRIALLLFAGLFGFATFQTAAAQSSDNHNVTINVNEVNTISVESDVSLTIDVINEWAGEGTTNFTVVTNDGNSKKVDARITGNQDGLGDYLQLRVSSSGAGSGQGNVVLSSDAQTVATGIENEEVEGTLSYDAQAGPEYDPTATTTVQVEYTLTQQ